MQIIKLAVLQLRENYAENSSVKTFQCTYLHIKRYISAFHSSNIQHDCIEKRSAEASKTITIDGLQKIIRKFRHVSDIPFPFTCNLSCEAYKSSPAEAVMRSIKSQAKSFKLLFMLHRLHYLANQNREAKKDIFSFVCKFPFSRLLLGFWRMDAVFERTMTRGENKLIR